ncbi:MAG: hypothetical protein WAT91_06405 [Saprospiraceae bacterium]
MIRYRTTRSVICQFVMCLFIFLTKCKNPDENPQDLSGYYLPVTTFPEKGMVYTYRNVIDTSADHEVWQHALTSKNHIISINYDSRQQVVQKQYEQIVYNGVIVDSLILFFANASGTTEKVPVKVLSASRFPFDAVDSTKVWLTKLEWWQPGDSLHVVLQRRRRFMGHMIWSSEGKSIPAIRFRTEDKFETEEVGWTNSEWTGEEIYAKDIGLVHYSRNISKQMHLEFELESRRPAKESISNRQ